MFFWRVVFRYFENGCGYFEDGGCLCFGLHMRLIVKMIFICCRLHSHSHRERFSIQTTQHPPLLLSSPLMLCLLYQPLLLQKVFDCLKKKIKISTKYKLININNTNLYMCKIVLLCRGWCGTLNIVVWYFGEGGLVL